MSLDPDDAPVLSLASRFTYPPLSVIDRRGGDWQARRRAWHSLGITSRAGRDRGLIYRPADPEEAPGVRGRYGDTVSTKLHAVSEGTSTFDPRLVELLVDWFSAPGGAVLDPYAGGSVRGIVTSAMRRDYLGVDLSAAQVEANRGQAGTVPLCTDTPPRWVVGDSRAVLPTLPDSSADLVLTCPPYHDLERYSDDPADLSAMSWHAFLDAYRAIAAEAVRVLRPHRFIAIVVGDVRDRRTGAYRSLPARTVEAFEDAGCTYENELIILDPVATAALRAARPFLTTRRIVRTHQYVLVFCTGDPKRAVAEQGLTLGAETSIAAPRTDLLDTLPLVWDE